MLTGRLSPVPVAWVSVGATMCGICGVVQMGGEPRAVLAPEVLDAMTDSMVHRGPNDRDVLRAPGVAFGARRLSIVDVEGGHQPFVSEDGRVWGMQNGELYNHAAIRRELEGRGHRFTSRCDTEVIPHLYEEHGPEFIERLTGKFGLAVWDGVRRRAVLARDRLGVKPLYWAVAGDLVVFASELKSLLASGLIEPRLDYEAIDAYLRLGHVPGPATPLEGVAKLPPGCRLVIDAAGARVERYWTYPTPTADAPTAPVEEYAERLLDALRRSVRSRLMSDVPLGAMLSGGLDSSLIVALMAEEMSQPVKTFSVGFGGSAGNELSDARMVADALGAEHHELELGLGDREVDLEDLAWHMDEPVASLSAIGFLALSRLAAQHVTVALSGQGADELLGGYRKHLAASLAGRVPGALAARAPGGGRAAGALRATGPVERLLAMSGRIDEATRARLATGPLAALDGGAAHRAIGSRLAGAPRGPLAETLYLDAQLALVDDMLHYFDRTSMAHSLEVRVPFLDHEVVELCATIPAAYKVRRLTTKYVLKRAAAGLVPEQVITKRKVGFFHRTVGEWFEGQMDGAVADYLLDPNPRYAEMIDRSEVERLVNERRAGRGGAGSEQALLGVLMLEIWLRSFLPRALATPPVPLRRAA
jgi:asparagine synthase (glutamine-hydrolysing)